MNFFHIFGLWIIFISVILFVFEIIRVFILKRAKIFNWLNKLLTEKKESRENLRNVVVGKILEIEKHPNADRLQVTKTDVGGKTLQIVCGAKNIEVGQLVPVALVGAKLSEDFEIKEAKIRGTESFGMICAEDELGLGDNHDGIMVLDETAEVGMEFDKYLNTK